jgi:hypothetical protein
LADYRCTAGQIYTGVQHLRLMEGVAELRKTFGTDVIDVVIVSAGYGLIAENSLIVPYEVTFNTMKSHEVEEWGRFLNIHQDFESVIANYDLIFVLLGDNYLKSLALPVKTRSDQTLLFLASGGSIKYIQRLEAKVFILKLSNREAKYYQYGLVGLKGFLFKQFANHLTKDFHLLDKIYQYPEFFKEVIEPHNNLIQLELTLGIEKVKTEEKKITKTKMTLDKKKSSSEEFLPMPNLPIAPNSHLGMQYFIPEWDDHVDPNYDFLNDILTPGRDTYKDEVYAHEIFSSPNYDGILVSKVVVESTKKKKIIIEKEGIQLLEQNSTFECDFSVEIL